MTNLSRLLDPESIAIVGLSDNPAKHGGRVLTNLRKLDYQGEIWGVHPQTPTVAGTKMFKSLSDLPQPPDLVVCTTPAAVASQVVLEARGTGGMIVFAGGFGESGDEGTTLETRLLENARGVGTRVLGPNSGGIIRPGRSLAPSFLTCLDRPATEIRSGSIGLVTQSGGIGSYIHNLSAARGGGLAVSVSTGNEVDIQMGEAIRAVAGLDEVDALLLLIEAVRDGSEFVDAVREATRAGKPVVACRIGTGTQSRVLMRSHTGAMAGPEAVFGGVLDSLDVVITETPEEGYEVAEILARVPRLAGQRIGVVSHSGGIAIHLADLADRHTLNLPQPSQGLRTRLGPLLDVGVANNPLDMGGIIGGQGRFAEVVGTFGESGEYDVVLAVSTAHPPLHSEERVEALFALETDTPVINLWMAGDQSLQALAKLRTDAAVTEEPRVAMRALAGLTRPPTNSFTADGPVTGPIGEWGLPLVDEHLALTENEAVAAAEQIGYPVVVKVESPGLAHKTEVDGVRLDLKSASDVRAAYAAFVESGQSSEREIEGVRVQPYRPGLEMIIGGIRDEVFGPLVSTGLGGVYTELLEDVSYAPAPINETGAMTMIDRLAGRAALDGYRGAPAADIKELARLIGLFSRGFASSGADEIEINPLIWDGHEWLAVDLLIVTGSDMPNRAR